MSAEVRRQEVDAYLDLVDAFVIELDDQGRIRALNAEAARILELNPEEARGASFDRFLASAESLLLHRQLVRSLAEGQVTTPVGDLELRAKSGSNRALRLRARRLSAEQGRGPGAVYSGRDISEERAAALSQGRSSKLLEDLEFALDVSAIVAITDRSGTITTVNDRFCEVSKFSREELIGRNHRIINSGFHPPEFFKQMWATIGRGEVWRGDIRNRAKDGSIYWVATTIVPFIDESGRPYQYLAIRNEITQRKEAEAALEKTMRDLAAMTELERARAEELDVANSHLIEANRRLLEEQAKLIQSEKLSSIGLLASGVAHEINNPLSGVLGCIKSLRKESLPRERREEYFETVRDGLERIQQIVRGLLEYARQRPLALESVDPVDLVASSLRLVAPAFRKKDLTIDDGRATSAPRVRADRAQMMQAIVNILLNAIYASPEHGTITIEIEARRPGKVGIVIGDEGSGFPPEIIERVCDPFFTTKPEGEGTGLGLSVTLSIAQANGGDLVIANGPNGGASVALWMQLDEGAIDA